MKVYVKEKITPGMRDSIREVVRQNPSSLSRDVICDFCGRANPEYLYRAHRMQSGIEAPCWRWCACEHCNMFIEKNDWSNLRSRIVRNLWKQILGFIPDTLNLVENGALVEEAVGIALGSFFRDAVEVEEDSRETDIKTASGKFNAHADTCPQCSNGSAVCERGMYLLKTFQEAMNRFFAEKEGTR